MQTKHLGLDRYLFIHLIFIYLFFGGVGGRVVRVGVGEV